MSYDMGFDVKLKTPHKLRGGTYAVGGDNDARINITNNYSKFFQLVLGKEGIRSLYGKTAAEIIILVEPAIKVLGTDRDLNYWAITQGNAGAALSDLQKLARLVPPSAVLRGD